MPGGRPHKHTPAQRADLVTRGCQLIATGQTHSDACRSLDVDPWLWRQYCDDSPELSALYARAREAQAHALADDTLRIADGEDEVTVMARRAIEAHADRLLDADVPEGVVTSIVRSLESALVQRDKLRVDTRKWFTGKVLPKFYGDKVQHEVDATLTVLTAHERETRVAALLTRAKDSLTSGMAVESRISGDSDDA